VIAQVVRRLTASCLKRQHAGVVSGWCIAELALVVRAASRFELLKHWNRGPITYESGVDPRSHKSSVKKSEAIDFESETSGWK
jgi:hypothetical protein